MSEEIKFFETGSIKFFGMFIPLSGEFGLPDYALERCKELLVARQCNCMQIYCGACRVWEDRDIYVLNTVRGMINKHAIGREAAYREKFFDCLVSDGVWQQALNEAFNILIHNAKHNFYYRDGDDDSILIADKLSGMERSIYIQEMLRGQISLCKQELDQLGIEECSSYMPFKKLKPAEYAKVCRGLPYFAILSIIDKVEKDDRAFGKFILRLREACIIEMEAHTGIRA